MLLFENNDCNPKFNPVNLTNQMNLKVPDSQDCNSAQQGGQLFIGEHQLQVVKICLGIDAIPLFGADVPLVSESIWLTIKPSRAEIDDQVELGEKL